MNSAQLTTTFVICLFCFYPQILEACLRMQSCRSLYLEGTELRTGCSFDGGAGTSLVLREDYTVDCKSTKQRLYRGVSVSLMLMVSGVYPLWFVALLGRGHN